MAKYEVKFDADGQDLWQLNTDTPEEAYESFLEDKDDFLDVPIVGKQFLTIAKIRIKKK